jgi:ATP adenylyltransferase
MFEPGTLKTQVIKQTKNATDKGILVPSGYDYECIVMQSDIPFIIRVTPNLHHKDKAREDQNDKTKQLGQEPNPFLPYNPDMHVSDLSSTHLCLLNRFKLFDYPLLIVTRKFEEQERLLSFEDFQGISICMQEMDGIAFYNGGLSAGASQRHKHFHFIPYPLDNKLSTVPIDNILTALPLTSESISLGILPYQHVISRIDWSNFDSPDIAAELLLSKYLALLKSIGQPFANTTNLIYSYNLLISRHWMMLALRSAPDYVSISLNALGFAGIFNVRSEAQVKQVKDLSPLTILKGIGVSR